MLVSNCILNESLLYMNGSKIALTIDNLAIADLSYERLNPSI